MICFLLRKVLVLFCQDSLPTLSLDETLLNYYGTNIKLDIQTHLILQTVNQLTILNIFSGIKSGMVMMVLH